jgi:hypothetical protein
MHFGALMTNTEVERPEHPNVDHDGNMTAIATDQLAGITGGGGAGSSWDEAPKPFADRARAWLGRVLVGQPAGPSMLRR